MNEVAVIVSIIVGAVALGSSAVTIAIYIGKLSGKFLDKKDFDVFKEKLTEQMKTDRHNCRNDCQVKISTIEANLTERYYELDRRSDNNVKILFERVGQISELISHGFQSVNIEMAKMSEQISNLKDKYESIK